MNDTEFKNNVYNNKFESMKSVRIEAAKLWTKSKDFKSSQSTNRSGGARMRTSSSLGPRPTKNRSFKAPVPGHSSMGARSLRARGQRMGRQSSKGVGKLD